MSKRGTTETEPAIEKNVVTITSVLFRRGSRTAELSRVQPLWAE